MTILQLTNTRVSDEDPEARSILARARALADAGHDVTLVTPIEESPALRDRAPRFIRSVLRRVFAAPAAPEPPESPPGSPPPDLVHVHHPFLVGEEGLRIAAHHDAPLVFTATLRYENPFPLPPAEAGHLRAFIEKLGVCFANRCDLVVAPSAAVAIRLFEGGVVRPIQVVPEDEPPEEGARRLAKIYADAVAGHRARRPARDPGVARRLCRELALAWNKIHPAAPFPVRRPGGVLAGLRGDTALPC